MRNFGDWNEVGSVAVAKPPMSEKDKAAKIRQAEEREAARIAERGKIRQRIAASDLASRDAAELASLRDQTAAEVEALKLRLGSLESQLIGDDDDNAILDEQADVAQQIARKQAQQNALHRRYLATAAMIDATVQSDLLTSGRPDLKAVATVRRRICELLERGLSGLRDDRGRYAPDQFAMHVHVYEAELALARARATEAVAAVRDE